MIDMKKMKKIIDLLHRKDWAAAHAMLDKIELADPDAHGIAHWRSEVLCDEGRHQEALQYLADNMHRFNCKTNAIHKRARILHESGNGDAALAEISKAPFDSEIEDYWALVMEAKFFRLYLMARAGMPLPPEQLAEIPDDYISLFPMGERISKERLNESAKRQ
jgi:hypothetical protein